MQEAGRSRVAFTCGWRGRKVYQVVGKSRQPHQAAGIVEIAGHRDHARLSQLQRTCRAAGQGIQPEPPAGEGKQPEGDVPGAHDQESTHSSSTSPSHPLNIPRVTAAMSFAVTIRPSNRRFEIEPGETLLEGALRQGITLPYGCRNGACGACKAKVLEGTVDYGEHAAHLLPDYEKKAGMALFCRATARTDLVVEAREITTAGQVTARKLPCRVREILRPTPDVAILRLTLPATERFQFLAGQYLEFLLASGKRRAYSMANPPEEDRFVELHVRKMAGGTFTDHVFNRLKERDILRFEGPLGTFFLDEGSDRPLVLVASGTGFAPIKSIVEHMLAAGIRRETVLYWGARNRGELYLPELPQRWQDENDRFTFIPVLSEPADADGWTGRQGFVHQAVMADFPDLSGYDVYACGAPVMVEAALRDFTATCGLPRDQFHSDAFSPSADAASAATPA